MAPQVVKRNGKRFVMVEEHEWRRVRRLAAQAETANEAGEFPDYPPADAAGNRPAVEYARVSIARKIIQDRRAAGLTQLELAARAGVRVETISRLESRKHSPTIRTVDKIDRALQRASKTSNKPTKKGS